MNFFIRGLSGTILNASRWVENGRFGIESWGGGDFSAKKKAARTV
jgi:hypothetical protein